ncbi:MAG: hypothetical protein R2688_02495 [Fimbriimonadaceae bacterium]
MSCYIKDAKALKGAFQLYWKEKKILLALPEDNLGKSASARHSQH